MTHWISEPGLLERFVLGHVPPDEAASLQRHLDGCPSCRERVEAERSLLHGIRRYGRTRMKARLRDRLRTRQRTTAGWAQIASIAVALILVTTAVLVLRFGISTPEPGVHERTVSLTPQADGPPVRPASFWLVGRVVFRSTGGATRAQTVLGKDASPAVQQTKEDAKRARVPIVASYAQARARAGAPELRDTTAGIRAFVERTDRGFVLTLYADPERCGGSITSVAVSGRDSLRVTTLRGEILFAIPQGWGS